MTAEIQEALSDGNPPLPSLLAVFSEHDAVEGCFDEESQTAYEMEPQPNLIIPLDVASTASVKSAFESLKGFCRTMAGVVALIDAIPGNENFVFQDTNNECSPEDRDEPDLPASARNLLYEDGKTTFATLHGVRATSDNKPELAAGRAVTTGFLRTLAAGLQHEIRLEILPEDVLLRTADAIAWWTHACCRPMFFRGDPRAEALNGKTYPHPALVFLVSGMDLYVRALDRNERPSANTRLSTAPYWNTDGRGLVCQGDMRVPDEISVDTIRGWEDGYFQSAFTHPSGAVRLTTHPRRFHGLWTELWGKDEFPNQFLANA